MPTAVRGGQWLGFTGRPIRNIVNIGIGGIDLGPVMAYEALRHYAQRDLTLRFVSNVDGTDLVEKTRDLNSAGDAVHRVQQDLHHPGNDGERRTRPARGCWPACRTRPPWPGILWRCPPTPTRCSNFGIDPANMFGFWDWVGGRYSMDSAIGLSADARHRPGRLS